MPLTSILIASDLSARSDRALERGFQVAAQAGARVTVASVIDDDAPAGFVADQAARTRAHLSAAARELAGDAPFEIRVETGDPAERLAQMACGPGVDLVVVGRHRHRGLLDPLHRTTVERVVARSRAPVLMAVTPVHGPYARALVPVGFSPACARAAAAAAEVAPGAQLRALHAWTAPFEGLTGGGESGMARAVEQELAAQSEAWGKTAPAGFPAVELVHGGLSLGVSEAIRSFDPDLVAIGAHTRPLSFAGLGGFAADMVRNVQADLLVARAEAG